MSAELAAATLRDNDAGDFTLPARKQYPHQWNWDSAFCALGWAALDPDRAWRELEALLAAQDGEGLVPSIAYRPGVGNYAPAPAWWGRHGGDGRRISAISQPPVAATCLRLLHERHPDPDRARALLAPLTRWHDFLLAERDPVGLGEPTVIHPWESGRDNAAEWDEALDRVPAAVRPDEIRREDVLAVAAAERPKDVDYSRYLALVRLGLWCDWDQRELALRGRFRVLDPAFSAILARACRDLGWLSERLGERELADRSAAHEDAVARALAQRAGADGLILPRDLITGHDLTPLGCGTALALVAPNLPSRCVRTLRDLVIGGALDSPFGVRSLSPGEPAYAPRRYWRGPAWANVAWLCALGLEGHGDEAGAAELRARMLRAVEAGGMREYVDPETGEGLGAEAFSWTAALTLWELSR